MNDPGYVALLAQVQIVVVSELKNDQQTYYLRLSSTIFLETNSFGLVTLPKGLGISRKLKDLVILFKLRSDSKLTPGLMRVVPLRILGLLNCSHRVRSGGYET
ncbi:unnamed protein product [Acanthoscelides obtectus]|uniref:Uncharacterized protein n=1 Tax=Acanthoscelides obtectus TaxID=200917 RepID=A0A9P0PU99_ACAOB|nr:unnamed protein product [Acanthoscelides obtectus]CAK1670327.1 hypothetical protein AOBTE_LOCUS27562 [Acanthoscelides obtectus]